MKTPKFLICENPFPEEGETAEFILHNYKPRFLSEVEALDFEEIEDVPDKPFSDILYVNSEGSMEVFRLQIIDYYETNEEEDYYINTLFKANNFYAKYLQELENLNGTKPGYPVKDFNKEIPGMKILHSPDRWTVVYNGLVADFKSEEEMDEFLEEELEVPQHILDKGVINNFD
jgi:hypothetical protein